MTVFFLLPSILLSGFMFPFRGMPDWAQWIGEALPNTHFLRIVRGILLKGNGWTRDLARISGRCSSFWCVVGPLLFCATAAPWIRNKLFFSVKYQWLIRYSSLRQLRPCRAWGEAYFPPPSGWTTIPKGGAL